MRTPSMFGNRRSCGRTAVLLATAAFSLGALLHGAPAWAQAPAAAAPAAWSATNPAAAPPGALAAPVTGTVDLSKPEQTLTGFGAATAYFENFLTGNPDKKDIYETLFKGLNLSILRLRDVYDYDDPSPMKDDAEIVKGAQQALGHPIKVFMASWSPKASLKSNGSVKGGGTLAKTASGAFDYAGFAQYWSDSLAAYAKLGIIPTYVSIQNEPDWKAEWESCLFQPKEATVDGMDYAGYDKALDAVYHQLKNDGYHAKLLGPEATGIADNKIEQFVNPSDTQELNELGVLAFHLYNGGKEYDPDSFIPALSAIKQAYPNKEKWESEYYPGDCFETAWIIHNCLVYGGLNAYCFWTAVWPNPNGNLIGLDDPAKPYLFTTPDGWSIGSQYWAIKHYSFCTEPGYHLVDASASNPAIKMTAFASPDNKHVTVVLLNTSNTETADFTLQIDGFTAQSSNVYQTVGNENFRDMGPLPSGGELKLPPRSIVTVSAAANS